MKKEEDFTKDFEKFGISLKELPDYTTPENHARNFKKFEMQEQTDVRYSSSTTYISDAERRE